MKQVLTSGLGQRMQLVSCSQTGRLYNLFLCSAQFETVAMPTIVDILQFKPLAFDI